MNSRFRIMRMNRRAAARRQYNEEREALQASYVVLNQGERWSEQVLPSGHAIQVRQATADRALRDRAIEAAAAAFGLAGAYLLATKAPIAAWAWVLFLASNAFWILFGVRGRHWFLVLQQLGFTYTSALGIKLWLL